MSTQEEIIRNRELVRRAFQLLGIKRYIIDEAQIDKPDVGVIIDDV